MGRVRAPFGVKGWVKVQPFTQSIDGLLAFGEWWVGAQSDWQNYRVDVAAVHGNGIIARLVGVEGRDAANALRGLDIGVPRSVLPEIAAGEYYWVDLVGLDVRNLEGEYLGKVDRILETHANPVVVLAGERERLLPFVEAVVREVDFDHRRMVVDWGSDF